MSSSCVNASAPKKRVLVVLPELPYPARKNGLTLRYFALLQFLSESFIVDLALLGGEDDSEESKRAIGQVVDRIFWIKRGGGNEPVWRKLCAKLLQLSPVGIPYDCYTFDASFVAAQMKSVLAGRYDAVIWVTLLQSHYFYVCLPMLRQHRLVIDAVDSIGLHWARRFSGETWIDRLRVRKMRAWEVDLMATADVGFYISPVDRDFVAQYLSTTPLFISPNGVVVDDYVSDFVVLRSPSLGFLGNMSYTPNVDAAQTLYRIYKKAKLKIPELNLYIIGRDPAPSITQLAVEDPDIHVTGTVDNIWLYVNGVDVFLLPMMKGSGQQNKLLEIMFAGKPIVATSIANGGVGAISGESVIIADDEQSLLHAVVDLLSDEVKRAKIAMAGKQFVNKTFVWRSIAEDYAHKVLSADHRSSLR